MVPELFRAKTRVEIYPAHHPALHTLDAGGAYPSHPYAETSHMPASSEHAVALSRENSVPIK